LLLHVHVEQHVDDYTAGIGSPHSCSPPYKG
jgi:hypothetical protein